MASASEVFLSRAQRRRREDIIEAALEVFDRDGFEGARIDDVAEKAEVAKGTVYLYFKNKNALFEGVIEAVVKPAIDSIESASKDEKMIASEKLAAQVNVMAERLARGQMKVVLRLMISEGRRHDDLRRFYFNEIVSPGMQAIQTSLREGEASGEFRQGAGQLAPQICAGVPLMAAVWQILFNDLEPLDIEKLLSDHLENVLKGLRSGAEA